MKLAALSARLFHGVSVAGTAWPPVHIMFAILIGLIPGLFIKNT
jgi:hypothetical protein